MNNVHFFTENAENTIPVTLILTKIGKNKLMMVKIIKDITGLGLKDSKDIVDNVDHNMQVIKTYLSKERILYLKEKLSECEGAIYEVNDIEYQRNRKLIELGISDKSDIVDMLVSQDVEYLFANFNYIEIKKILFDRYSDIPEDKIKEILNIKP